MRVGSSSCLPSFLIQLVVAQEMCAQVTTLDLSDIVVNGSRFFAAHEKLETSLSSSHQIDPTYCYDAGTMAWAWISILRK